MAQLIFADRSPGLLRHPKRPCLSEHYAVNLTHGCPFDCRYCYNQSLACCPGQGNVKFYSNAFRLLKRQLYPPEVKGKVVHFSTVSEPFVPIPVVLDEQYLIMEALLRSGALLRISTKATVPGRFVELFQAYPGQVFVQVSITEEGPNRNRWGFLSREADDETRLDGARDCGGRCRAAFRDAQRVGMARDAFDRGGGRGDFRAGATRFLPRFRS